MAAFWAVFTFGGSGPALTAHGSLDLKQEIQIQIQISAPCVQINNKISSLYMHKLQIVITSDLHMLT
jgi:hypothetical protein